MNIFDPKAVADQLVEAARAAVDAAVVTLEDCAVQCAVASVRDPATFDVRFQCRYRLNGNAYTVEYRHDESRAKSPQEDRYYAIQGLIDAVARDIACRMLPAALAKLGPVL